jgi:predicted dehydrogenase
MKFLEDTLNVGIIGLGKMGLLHASILSTFGNVQVVALCDKNRFMRRISKKLFKGAKIVDDISGLSQIEIDAIYVTTPIPSHFFIINKIFSERIANNWFVEKTLASNYAEARELCKLAQCSIGIAMVGYMKRFAVTFRKAKDVLNNHLLGDLVSFDAYAFSSDFAEIKKSNVSSARGGVLCDLGSHVVDLALWFFGNLTLDSAKIESINAPSSEDKAIFCVSQADLKGKFTVSWCETGYRMPEFGFVIRGTNGILRVTDDIFEIESKNGKLERLFRHDLNDNVDFLLGAPEYFREDHHFIRSIIDHKIVESDFIDASKVDDLLSQIKTRAV